MEFIDPKVEVKNIVVKEGDSKPKKLSMRQIFIVPKRKKQYKKK